MQERRGRGRIRFKVRVSNGIEEGVGAGDEDREGMKNQSRKRRLCTDDESRKGKKKKSAVFYKKKN